MTPESEPARSSRVLVISVKDPSGDWMTLPALEVLVTQPMVVYSNTAGVVTISAAVSDADPR